MIIVSKVKFGSHSEQSEESPAHEKAILFVPRMIKMDAIFLLLSEK
ncbi:MAG: hypothetical protein JETT_1199 [Candidatus Jettenia ecosi]|uniref:Uncharacterized protein n=1 Tax=Candidatus Jettenia ecosi TaxID=2494326 RepID=A0A533QCI8_9BACT|nr:MAG: hypothetical protein JETT_1199 [Candidatus Jettenia ecosi]